MKYKLIYIDLALDDLVVIKEYLSNFYPGTWFRFIENLEKSISKLSSMPYICEKYHFGSDYRQMVVDNYLVFYKINEKLKEV